MHQPLFAVAYSHCAAWLAGLVLRRWGFRHHTCGDTGVTYWLVGGKKGAKARGRGRGRRGRGGEAAPAGAEAGAGTEGGCSACVGGGGGKGTRDARKCFAGCHPPLPVSSTTKTTTGTDGTTTTTTTPITAAAAAAAPVVVLHGGAIQVEFSLPYP